LRVYENITEVFGNTPLVRLNKITDGAPAQVFAKLEFYNPSSSVKDRLGIAMINEAESSGELKPGGTIIEATSGNTGISLAMVGAARGYRTIIVMPDSLRSRAHLDSSRRRHEGLGRKGRGAGQDN